MNKEFDEDVFYDLRYDVYFKNFFLNNKMLAGFLSLLWKTKVNPEDITYDNTESVLPLGKKIIYDVVANVTLHGKEEINVNLEMRVFDRRSIVFKFILRSLYTMYIIPLFFLSNV